MIKATILLPTHYNDGKRIESYKLESALSEITHIIGGTIQTDVLGSWKRPDGTFQRETFTKIEVVCEDAKQVSQLRDSVKAFAPLFSQDCIYFETQQCNMELI